MLKQLKLRVEQPKIFRSGLKGLRAESYLPKLGFILIALGAVLTALLIKLFSEIAFR